MRTSVVFVLSVLLVSCVTEDAGNQDGFLKFDRKAMLRGMAENVIAPGFEELRDAGTALSGAVLAFAEAPNASTLDSAQESWIAAAKAWKRVEFIKIGELDEATGLAAKIDFGSADPLFRTVAVDKSALSAAINSGAQIDRAFVEAQPATLQGFPVIEALLFGNDDAEVLASYEGNTGNARKLYLGAVTASLNASLQRLASQWRSGQFVESFAAADLRDEGSSLGMLVNDFVYHIEASMRNEKVGRPIGFRTNDTPQPESVEARLSEQSIPFLRENIDGLKRLYTGDAFGKQGRGFDALLDHLGAQFKEQPLSKVIADQFDVVTAKLDALPPTMTEAVLTDLAKAKELHHEIQGLTRLTKVDMSEQIGVMIHYADNDGD